MLEDQAQAWQDRWVGPPYPLALLQEALQLLWAHLRKLGLVSFHKARQLVRQRWQEARVVVALVREEQAR